MFLNLFAGIYCLISLLVLQEQLPGKLYGTSMFTMHDCSYTFVSLEITSIAVYISLFLGYDCRTHDKDM